MNQANCLAAEAAVLDKADNIERGVHVILGMIIFILLIRLVCTYRTKSVKLHPNLIVSFNEIVLLTYSNPCDCLNQVWFVCLIRIPSYIYFLGSPMFHFAIMIERVLATINVKIYEKQGKMIAIIGTIIVVKF
uniref:G protein-coupled receptor n=1 Tax=Meloidogyne hapla TaxID=6305 RepID=A0A1I8BQ17_MELHA